MARKGPATALGSSAELTLLAHVKPGFVEGTFGTHTYAFRLEALLKTLNAMRLKAREEITGNPFADTVAGIGTIESFRYVVLPAEDGVPRKLLLNVIFDRAWEPYMRFIYRDIGTLLDVIFCNCIEYPMAYFCDFDAYMRWVRKYEVEGGLFYTDSPLTVGDRRYLKRVEALHRCARNPAQADIDAAALAVDEAVLPPDPTAPTEPIEIARRGLPALAALYELNLLYAANTSAPLGGDAGMLLRAMHDLLRGLRALPTAELFDAASPERQRFARQLEWLERPRIPPLPRKPDRIESIDAGNVQGGILHGYDLTTHGCLMLMHVSEPAGGKEFLRGLGVTPADTRPTLGKCAINVALTFSGLARLGVPEAKLDQFPAEFREGMEARCGSLGDLRGNHPANWRRPERYPPQPQGAKDVERIELDSVHIVVQLRVASVNGGADLRTQMLAIEATAHGHGVELLSVQEMNLQRNANGALVEHFGFVDAISQPTLENSHGVYRRDRVPRGEILLGYCNARGDGPWPAEADALFDDGSFLVVRKLRQDVPALDDWLDRQRAQLEAGNPPIVMTATQLKEAMLGRRLDGKPLVERRVDDRNDFDFRDDPRGMQCPFQSHVRRANPRNGTAMRPVPRIMRRGMLYGEPGRGEGERGVMFMAYNASIAEQFEVVQRWIAGGNSSGLCSAQSDPLLGVPQPGDPRTFRFVHEGRVVRVDLDTAPDRPFVRLEWGVYLFVPSLKSIASIADGVPAPQQAQEPPQQAQDPKMPVKLALEDPDRRAERWAEVRAAGGVVATPYGELIGSKSEVMQVFRDNGSTWSVSGYGRRMDGSIGSGFLGIDEPEHTRLADAVNQVIESVGEVEAFTAARGAADKVLTRLLDTNEGVTGKREATFDIKELADRVLAGLCSHWFGLPDAAGALMQPGGWTAQPAGTALCPGHLLSASRYVFHPDPSEAAERFGKTHGTQVLDAVKKMVANGIPAVGAKLSRDIADKLRGVSDGKPELIARTIAGVMLGFPPTVFGNLVQTVKTWLESRQVWSLQNDLLGARAAAPQQVYERARDKLRPSMLLSMRDSPVPEMLWRTCPPDPKTGKSRHVVVGIISAAHEDREKGYAPDEALLFGGERKTASKTPATHACPGRYMATGVMLGVLSAILEAGSLRAAGPTGFTVSRR